MSELTREIAVLLSQCPWRNEPRRWGALKGHERSLLDCLRADASATQRDLDRLRELVKRLGGGA